MKHYSKRVSEIKKFKTYLLAVKETFTFNFNILMVSKFT
jgi:hypothetical protein